MKFLKVVDGGTVHVRIDPEGLKLPALPDGFDLASYLDFKIGFTYKTLAASRNEDEWNIVFGYPEKFLNQCTDLSESDKGAILSTMVYMHYLIRSKLNADNINPEDKRERIQAHNKAEIFGLEIKLAEAMCSLDSSIGFLDKLRKFSADSRYVPQPENNPLVGTRSQDTREKTLFTEDQIILTSLAIMAKLFSPVSSVFINACKDINLDNMFYEIHCNTMYRRMLDEKYPDLMNKLDGIIRGIVEKKLKDISDTDIYNGNTVEVLVAKNIAGMLTRKLVVVNLDQKGTNLATYIHACVQSTTNSSSGNKHKLSVMSRKQPNDNINLLNGDGNESILETESMSSSRTADFEDIITFAVDTIVKQHLASKTKLVCDTFYAAVSYYDSVGHLVVDPVNSYLLGIMYSEELMGGKSIELLRSIDLSRLVALAQIELIDQGYSYELVELISARSTGGVKMTNTGAEIALTSGGGWRSSRVYANLNDRFKFSCNGITWDTGLQNIVNAVTHTSYAINIAPSIIAYTGETKPASEINDREFSASSQLAEDICILILNYTEKEM